MPNNLALFATHHVFLTDDEILRASSGASVSCVGHCVPVWVEAKSGRTTEPAKEAFCSYELSVVAEGPGVVELVEGLGYRVMMPRDTRWTPPKEIDFAEISTWTSEMRQDFLSKRELWWFNNPRMPDVENLKRGYLRFDFKRQGMKIGRRKYSVQHVVEISSIKRLMESLTT